MKHFSALKAKKNIYIYIYIYMKQRQKMEKWQRKNVSDIRQVSRTECFTNRKIGERTINRTNIVDKIKEQEDKALTKKPNEKEINNVYFLEQIIQFIHLVRSFPFRDVYCCLIVIFTFALTYILQYFGFKLNLKFLLCRISGNCLIKQVFYAQYVGIFAVCHVPRFNTTREVNCSAFTPHSNLQEFFMAVILNVTKILH